MKDYHEVVENRFNQAKVSDDSIYSASHPVGKHIRDSLYRELKTFLSAFYPVSKPVAEKKLLDLGCGEGGMLRFLQECGFTPGNCTGVDFSELRVQQAMKDTPGTRLVHGDAIKIQLNDQFDLITSFDLFSHFPQKEQIIEGLKNAAKHLAPGGLFLWYDICSNDHFKSPENAESWGFSRQQMIELAGACGLEPVYSRKLFKRFFNKYHSAYQAKRIPKGLLRLFEKILPGKPGNLLLVFRKKSG